MSLAVVFCIFSSINDTKIEAGNMVSATAEEVCRLGFLVIDISFIVLSLFSKILALLRFQGAAKNALILTRKGYCQVWADSFPSQGRSQESVDLSRIHLHFCLTQLCVCFFHKACFNLDENLTRFRPITLYKSLIWQHFAREA